MTDSARTRIAAAVDAIEEAYEFFLAFAAQGMTAEDQVSPLVGRLRKHLDQTASAVSGLASDLSELIAAEELESPTEIEAFREVVERDAKRAGAVISLLRSRSAISSQLVDNLNASVHVRTLLTDLFLLDEILKLGVDQATEPQATESAP